MFLYQLLSRDLGTTTNLPPWEPPTVHQFRVGVLREFIQLLVGISFDRMHWVRALDEHPATATVIC